MSTRKVRPEKMWCVGTDIKGTFYLHTSTIDRTRAGSIKMWLKHWESGRKPDRTKWKYWYANGARCIRVDVVAAAVHAEIEPKVQPNPATLKHVYQPNSKYPWFCKICGYPEHESLQHLDQE